MTYLICLNVLLTHQHYFAKKRKVQHNKINLSLKILDGVFIRIEMKNG